MSNERAVQLVDAATWLQLSGDTEGARRLFEQALKLDPGNVKALEHLAGTRGTTSIDDITTQVPVAAAGSLDADWGAATSKDAALPPPPPPADPASVWDSESTRVAAVPVELLGPPPPPADAVAPTVTAPMGKTAEMFKPPPLPINEDTLFGDLDPTAAGAPPPPPPGDEAATSPSIPVAPPPPPSDDFASLPPVPAAFAPPPPPSEPSEMTEPNTPALSAAAAASALAEVPLAPSASSAWDARSNPGIQLAGGAEARAMELLASATNVAVPPPEPQGESVDRLMRSAKDLLDLDDHTGAMELILKAKALAPNDPEVEAMRERSEATLVAMFESKLRSLLAVPRVLLKDDEIIWLNLDHRAGFVLAQIDTTVSFEDIFSLSGMSRLDTARILAQLIDEGVISRG